MSTIYFKKEENRNVTIRNSGNNAIIISLQPNQNVFKGVDSESLFFIKSKNAGANERGIPINCNDINLAMCIPQILVINDFRDDIITALTNSFFFINQQNITTNHLDLNDLTNNSNNKFLRETDLDLDFLLNYNISKL